MLQTRNLTIKLTVAVFLLLLIPLSALAQDYDKENKDLYREFIRLFNSEQEEEFHAHANKYLDFLSRHQLQEEYFKIKTNVGFFCVAHQHPLQAMRAAIELEEEIRATGDTTLLYLVSGLKGDIYKFTHIIPKADSIYKKALHEVGGRDKKFAMLVHMKLAETNLAVDPEIALGWANKALREANSLGSIEYQSMSLGTKGYLFFMMAERDSFQLTIKKYRELEAKYQQMKARGETLGKHRFSHFYDTVIDVAETAFSGDYERAIEMAQDCQLNVDKQMVVFRIFGMEGVAEKEKANQRLRWGFAIMTILYLFVYVMGRRRLWRKIQQRKAELSIALEKAETANKMKAAFIRSMSHEIRTPLNAINGFSQILCTSEFELSKEEKEDMKQRITSNTEAITLIINELLELAAGESVTLDEANLIDVAVNDVCREATAKANKQNKKGLQLRFTTELLDDFHFKSNDETISRILQKIIDNAMKFTNEGTIDVHADVKNGMVEISVTDTGVGIPEDKQNDVFNNFVKLDDNKEGIGLGLPICLRLAHSLEGEILLDKTYKKGSRFILRLPVR